MELPFINDETYDGHSGVDFPQKAGTTILASAPGRISYVGWLNDNAGYSVIVDYDNGPAVLYCHQLKNCWRPNVNSRVDYGWTLGSVGTTGRSTGNHLHMEIMRGNGAHTYAGIWNYFKRDTAVNNKPAPSGNSNTGTIENGETEMYFAIIRRNGNDAWYQVIPQGNGKPKAVILGANAIFSGTANTPVVIYEWNDSIAAFERAVDYA